MNTLRTPLRAVFYRECDQWIAHCLELDVLGHGRNKEEALDLRDEAILTQIEASIEYNNLGDLFFPADAEIFRRFAAGNSIEIGEIEPLRRSRGCPDRFEIEDVFAREFSEPVATLAVS